MILFHGTSTEHLPRILKEGLQPRNVTKQASNWKDDVESKPDLVYLTTAYPVYFAAAATEEEYKPVVIKVCVDEDDLYPDEDFVALCSLEQDKIAGRKPRPLTQYNSEIDPKNHKEMAGACLKYNGIVAIEEVLPNCIVDHVELPSDWRLMHIGADSMPIPLNYQILGPFYCQCIEALFNGGVHAAMQVVLAKQKKDCAGHPELVRGLENLIEKANA